MESAQEYIANYSDDSAARIAFAWNGKRAAEFVDLNMDFRREVLKRSLPNLREIPLKLIRDLFLAEAAWAKEAWCVNADLHLLGQEMLVRGRTLYLQDFLSGAMSSFDTAIACGRVSLEPALKEQLADFCKARAKESNQQSIWNYGLEKFSPSRHEDPSHKNWLSRLFGQN